MLQLTFKMLLNLIDHPDMLVVVADDYSNVVIAKTGPVRCAIYIDGYDNFYQNLLPENLEILMYSSGQIRLRYKDNGSPREIMLQAFTTRSIVDVSDAIIEELKLTYVD